MHIGSLRVRLFVRESRSLKDKRQVVKSIIDRLRNGFNVAVAEVDEKDHHQTIVLGITTVGDEAQYVTRTLELVANALRGHPVAQFCECQQAVESSTL
jgi:uncharacterized protein YlxP (DUF503 family)